MINSPIFAIFITLLGYYIGVTLRDKYKSALFNPIIVGAVFVFVVLKIVQIDISDYQQNTQILSFFIAPATIALGVILYKHIDRFEKHAKPIMLCIFVGSLVNLVVVYLMAYLFKLNRIEMISLLPKSVTVAIGVPITETFGGWATLTLFSIVLTGIVGNILAKSLLKLFKIKSEIAQGVAIGTSSHVIGTSKAIELGEVQGAMSSLSIVLTGLLTLALMIILEPLFALLF